MTDVASHWQELVTAALLGTDRRDPPDPPEGPVRDLVADAVHDDPAVRLLATVAAVTAVRRAASLPDPPADRLAPPEPDDRPWCPPSSSATWRRIVVDWPVLEDEWVLTLWRCGLRPSPDVLVELLSRHRTDPVRRGRVVLAAGPVARWLVGHVPVLAAPSPRSVSMDDVESLPDLPVPTELRDLLVADGTTLAGRLADGFGHDRFGPASRAVLVNVMARCRPDALADVRSALASLDDVPGAGLARRLGELADLRHRMLVELGALDR